MIEMYDGIYVTQFVVFYGDSIKYEIILAEDGEVLESGTVSNLDVTDNEMESRYARLNRIESDLLYQNDADLIGDMKDYQALMEITGTLFTAI